MKERRPPFYFSSFRVKVMFFFILAMAFLAVTTNFIILRYSLNSQFEQLRQKLMGVAGAAAAGIDPDTLSAIPLEKSGMDTPQYLKINARLNEIKATVPGIKYIYIMTKTAKPGILQFVVDADANDSALAEPDAFPGYEYNASRFPEMLKGFDRLAADRTLTTDEWGVFLSGYAPIRDAQKQVVAILGVDMRAQDVYLAQLQIKRRGFMVLFLGIILGILFSIYISGRVTRQIKKLMEGARRIAQGDLEYKVSVTGKDEIAQLGHIFNKMSVELKRYIEELQRTTAEKERLMKELEIARGIQQSFLPESSPKIGGFDLAAMNLPASMVGGDFYDYIPIEKDIWGVVIADVSGKGVPAALFMALSRTLMRASATVSRSPSEAINHVNQLILRDSKTNMFVTLFYAVLDAKRRVLSYANAGHNPAIHLCAGSRDILFLRAQAMPLGISPEIEAVTEEISLKRDDIVMLYTDGVTEAINEERQQFELSRLERVIRDNRFMGARDLMHKVSEEVSDFVGKQPQFDDITMMIIKAL